MILRWPTNSCLRGKTVGSCEKSEDNEGGVHFLYTRLITDLMRLLVNYWSPLTHTSHCMTTSWSATATQMKVRVSPTMHPNVFYAKCPSCSNPSNFWAWAWLRTCWRPVYSETTQLNSTSSGVELSCIAIDTLTDATQMSPTIGNATDPVAAYSHSARSRSVELSWVVSL